MFDGEVFEGPCAGANVAGDAEVRVAEIQLPGARRHGAAALIRRIDVGRSKIDRDELFGGASGDPRQREGPALRENCVGEEAVEPM